MELELQNPEFTLLDSKNPEFKILDCQNPEFTTLDCQSPKFKIVDCETFEEFKGHVIVTVNRLIDSIPKRMDSVIRKRGVRLKY